VKDFLKHGADINAKDEQGQTALDIALASVRAVESRSLPTLAGLDELKNTLGLLEQADQASTEALANQMEGRKGHIAEA
jgi:hypothetical protein